MSLSKFIFNGLGFYFEQLFTNPIRTKSLTCGVVSTVANYTYQIINGNKVINDKMLVSYGTFGLLFGGVIPHYFWGWLENTIDEEVSFSVTKKLLLIQLIYSPLFQAFMLYTLARLEGKNHKIALAELKGLYFEVIITSWKYLTIIEWINETFVPSVLRVLVINLITFFWTIFISYRRNELKTKT